MKNNFLIILFTFLLLMACSRKQYTYKSPAPKTGNTVVAQQIYPDTSHKKDPNTITYIPYEINPETYYGDAFCELKNMLEGKQALSFKRAVFVTENTYFENTMDYTSFDNYVKYLSEITKAWSNANTLSNYKYADSINMKLNGAIFHTLTDTVFGRNNTIINLPYRYDFEDCFAKENWTNMFVTKLLYTHKGNCHSLPFLYKIVADELKVKAWLSFTPNHIYLRNWSKKTGWYNTELTNAMFPSEAWIMTSGYVSLNSIVSGIYMDTLGIKQSVAVCVNDLAKGYIRKFKTPDLQFILNCCDLGLKYYSNYGELLLLKAETHKKVYENYIDKYGLNAQNPGEPFYEKIKFHLDEMNKTYGTLAKLDYREIPENMFMEWMQALLNNKEKYADKKIYDTFKYKSHEN